MKFIKSFLIVSRANIQIASLPTVTIGIFFAAEHWKDIFDVSILLFIILFFTALTYSCNINCLNDLEVDEKSKKYLSDAAKSIGLTRLEAILKVEVLVMGIIIVSLCVLKREITYLLAIFGILCGYIYSAPPFRLKKRGIISPLPVMLGLYFLPLLAGAYIVSGQVSLFIILFGIGYMLIMQGITFINTCEDYEEDRNSKIHSLAHIIGIKKTLFLGSIFVSVGGFIDLLLISYKIKYEVFEITLSTAIITLSLVFLLSIFWISKSLYFSSVSPNPIAQSKQNAKKMPLWFLSTRYPLFFISLLVLLN